MVNDCFQIGLLSHRSHFPFLFTDTCRSSKTVKPTEMEARRAAGGASGIGGRAASDHFWWSALIGALIHVHLTQRDDWCCFIFNICPPSPPPPSPLPPPLSSYTASPDSRTHFAASLPVVFGQRLLERRARGGRVLGRGDSVHAMALPCCSI